MLARSVGQSVPLCLFKCHLYLTCVVKLYRTVKLAPIVLSARMPPARPMSPSDGGVISASVFLVDSVLGGEGGCIIYIYINQ